MFDRYRRENSPEHPYHIPYTYQEAIEKENDLYTPEYTAKIKKRKHYRVTPRDIITNISNARSNCTDLWTQYAVRAFDDFVEDFPKDTLQDIFEEAIMWPGASIETLELSDVFRVAYDKEMPPEHPDLFWKDREDYPDLHNASCFLVPSCFVSELARAANLCQNFAIEPDKPPLWYSVFQFFVDVASLHEDLRHTRPSHIASRGYSWTASSPPPQPLSPSAPSALDSSEGCQAIQHALSPAAGGGGGAAFEVEVCVAGAAGGGDGELCGARGDGDFVDAVGEVITKGDFPVSIGPDNYGTSD
jgi:hypothetical protein